MKITLKILSEHLRKPQSELLHEQWDFLSWNYPFIDEHGSGMFLTEVKGIPNCGYAGCAAGELPLLDPEHWKFSGTTAHNTLIYEGTNGVEPISTKVLANYFNISEFDAQRIFVPASESGRLGADATKDDVADQIDRILQENPSYS